MWINSTDFYHSSSLTILSIITKGKKSMMERTNPFEVNQLQLISFNMLSGRSKEREINCSCPFKIL